MAVATADDDPIAAARAIVSGDDASDPIAAARAIVAQQDAATVAAARAAVAPTPKPPPLTFSPLERAVIASAPPAQGEAAQAAPAPRPPVPSPGGLETEQAQASRPPGPSAFFNPKTGTWTTTPAFGESPLDVPAEGVARVARGVKELGQPAAPSGQQTFNPKTGKWESIPAVSPAEKDILGGALEASTVALPGAAATAPVETALAVAKGTVVSKAAGAIAAKMGATPDEVQLVSDAAGAAAASVDAGDVLGKAREAVAKTAADARAVRAVREADEAAHATPTEPIPVGKGATPAAAGRLIPEEGSPGQLALPPAGSEPSAAEAGASPTGGQPAPGTPPAPPTPIAVEAAVRDLATATPNSPQARTALAALDRAGLSLDEIHARVVAARTELRDEVAEGGQHATPVPQPAPAGAEPPAGGAPVEPVAAERPADAALPNPGAVRPGRGDEAAAARGAQAEARSEAVEPPAILEARRILAEEPDALAPRNEPAGDRGEHPGNAGRGTPGESVSGGGAPGGERLAPLVAPEEAGTAGATPAEAPAALSTGADIPRNLDDLQARRLGMPPDLRDDLNLILDERRWHRAVTTPGASVRLEDGTIGTVVRGATNPVNGTGVGNGMSGMVLVKHVHEGLLGSRWYPALRLEAVGPTSGPSAEAPEVAEARRIVADLDPSAMSNPDHPDYPVFREAVNDLAARREAEVRAGALVAPALPRELAGAKPRFNIGSVSYHPQFASDLDKAAYILAQKTPSARDADYLAFVQQHTGLDEPAARALGQQVKTAVKGAVKGQPAGPILIPPVLAARTPPQAASSPPNAPQSPQVPASGTIIEPMSTSATARVEREAAPKLPPTMPPGPPKNWPYKPALATKPAAPVRRLDETALALQKERPRLLTGFQHLFAPYLASEAARQGAGTIRAQLGAKAQREARAFHLLHKAMDAFDTWPEEDRLRFDELHKTGRIAEMPAAWRPYSQLLDDLDAETLPEIQRRGKLQNYREHYIRQLWEDPDREGRTIAGIVGKRPLQGGKGWQKRRLFPTLREGIAKGLKPVTTNPMRAALLGQAEKHRFIFGYDTLKQEAQKGLAEFVRAGAAPKHEHYVQIADPIGTVYGKPSVTVKEAYDEKLMDVLYGAARSLGVNTVTKAKMRGGAWGYTLSEKLPNGKVVPKEIGRRFGGPETVLMHELGHVLDHKYDLGEKLGKALDEERFDEADPDWKKTRKELAQLADLREEGKPITAGHRAYLHSRPEKVANAVHAFIYARDRMKEVAPNTYWALWNLAKDDPARFGWLVKAQRTRSLVLGSREQEIPVGGAVIRGYWYAHPDVARLLNNYVTPGLRGNGAYDLVRRAANAQNRMQLGLSGFHLVATALNSAASTLATGLEQISRGHVLAGLKTAAETPVAPLLAIPRAARTINAYRGALNPQDRALTDTVRQIIEAGGRVTWDPYWHSDAPETFTQALHAMQKHGKESDYKGLAKDAFQVVWRALPALLEATSRPIMGHWVPMMKTAALQQALAMELEDLGGEHADLGEVQRVFGERQDSIDNRFGELVYDNLFMDPMLRDLAFLTFRAPGWNLGDVREFGGAVPGQLNRVGLLPQAAGGGGFGKPPTRTRYAGTDEGGNPRYERGPEPKLHYKAAYVLAYVLISALTGGTLQYLLSGLLPGEREKGGFETRDVNPGTTVHDLFFPRTGNINVNGTAERLTVPGYMKDIYAFEDNPQRTLVNKMAPELLTAYEIIDNQDYYGNQIRNPDDVVQQQLKDVAEFLVKQSEPISVQSFLERRASANAGTAKNLAASALGISPAPSWATASKAQKLIWNYEPPSQKTAEQAAQGQLRTKIREALKKGDLETARRLAGQGQLTARQLQTLAHNLPLSGLQEGFRSLTFEQALRVYLVATPEERAQLRPLLERKANTAQVPPADLDRIRALAQKAAALPVPKLAPMAGLSPR